MRHRYVARRHCRRFAIADLAFTLKKENDYTVVGAFAVTPRQDLIVLDIHRERMEGPEIPRAIAVMYRRWDCAYVAVEAQQAQILVVQQLRRMGLTVRALRADVDKLSRAIPATVRFEAGQVYLPEDAPWVEAFVAELLTFPHGKHDDQVDVISYACIELQRFGPAPEPEGHREAREYAEKELAAESFNRVENPLFWEGDADDD